MAEKNWLPVLKDAVISWLGSLTFSWHESGSIRKEKGIQDAVLELSHTAQFYK